MELTLLTFNLIFGTSLIILYLVGLVAWKYYDKKQRLFRKDILKRVSRHVNSTRKGEHHVSQHEPLESTPPIVIFPLSRQEIYPYEKQETFPSQTHTPSSHRIRRSSIDCTHLHQSLHSSTSLHYDHHKWIKIMWDLYELLPPVPYLSVLIQYLSDPVVFVERCAKIYGPCFSIYAWFGIKWTFMVGPDSNRIFFSDIEGKQSNLFNPLIDYSKASEMLNKAFERSDILPRNHQICLPFISRRVRWHPLENEPELKEEPITKKQLLTEKEHLKQMLHEGFSSIQPLSEFVLENIRKEVKSSLFHLNHINLDFVDKNEMPAIAEADLETPKQLFGITEDIFTEGLKKQQFNDQVLVMGDVFSHMSRFVIKSVLRSIFGSTFAKSHGDELSEIVSTLQVSCCDPLMMCYYNFFRFKLLENVWVPNKVYEIELKKKRLHELLFREIERHVKIYQFNMTNASTKKPCLKNANYANNSLRTYGCYMDYVLENLGPNLSKYGSTIEHTMSIYAIHFEELILSVHKHEVTNLSWTICHLAQDQSLQDKVRKEIFQFQDELKNQMASLISQKTDTEEYLSKFDHLNGVMNDNNFDEPRKELLEGIHTLKKEDLDLLNRVNSMDETPPTTFSANDISDPFASHTSLDTIPSESIGTLSSAPSSPVGFVPSPFSRSNDELKENTFPSDQDTINYTEEQIITGELIPPHYLNVNRTVSPSKTEQLTLPNMDNLSLAAQAPMQSIAQSKNYDFNVETISPDLVHKGLVQKKLLFNALFVESVLSSSFDKQFESMHHSGLLNPDENNLRLLDACFKETTRQYSLKFMTGKTTKLDFRTLRYFNYDIPSGQFVSIVPYFSHHSKEYFPFETHTYRPERFLELYHPDEKEETPTIEVSNSDTEKQPVIRGGPSEVSELSFNKSNSIEEDRSLMNKLRVDQAFTQYGYVPCKSHQQIVKNGESIESNTSVLLDTCLGCNFIHLSSRVFVIELLTHYKVEIPQWQKADVSSNRYLSSESHDCAFPIHPVALVLNPFL